MDFFAVVLMEQIFHLRGIFFGKKGMVLKNFLFLHFKLKINSYEKSITFIAVGILDVPM